MMTRVLALWTFAAALSAAACTVGQTSVPPLTGPSDYAQSLTVTATPDSITLGQSAGSFGQSSTVLIKVFNASGEGLPGVDVRLEILVGSIPQDCGRLNSRIVRTASDGTAVATYTAPGNPPPPPACAGFAAGDRITIRATPVGTNFDARVARSVSIQLVPLGVILPPPGTPTPLFFVSPTPVTVGLPVTFDASASTPGAGATQLTYNWNFGDGDTGSGVRDVHDFGNAGTFSVTLTVTNDRGISAAITQPVTVTAIAAGSGPTASFTFSPGAPAVGETVFFNASNSRPGAGHTIVSYQWTFGDGGTGTGVAPTHAYLTAGTYTVQLTVTDEVGQTALASQSVTPGNPPAPTSNFTFSPTEPAVGQQVVFDASSSTTAQGQTIVDVAWNFGDGTAVFHCPADPGCTTTNSRISAHTYAFSGTFIVNLVVTDSAGRTGQSSQSVVVSPPNPTAVLILSKTGGNSILADGSLSTATGSFTIVTYRFIWGDGTLDTVGAASSASHTFAAPGVHTVTMVVTDNAVPARTGATSREITTP